MNILKMICGNCAGMGYINETITTPTDDSIYVKVEREICNECKGIGYTEYAVFSVEEAKAILKHCGLNTED